MMRYILQYLAAVAISIVAAIGYAYLSPANGPSQSSTASQAANSDKVFTNPQRRFIPLPPVVANLRFPSDSWIRLDVSVAVDAENVELFNKIRDKISEDILMFARTLTMPEIEEAYGLIYLKADLTERLQIRSESKLKELAITSMVIQ